MQRNSGIGGQAIMEGIMMRNREKYSIAVRNPEGEIEISVRDFRSVCPFSAAHRIPGIRGAVSFIDSLVTGVSSLMWSADIASREEEEEGPKTVKEKETEE